MKRIHKVRTKQMFRNLKNDLRTEFLAMVHIAAREVGALIGELMVGVWEGLMEALTGPQKPVRRPYRARRR
ncbi:MAG: hypothetical protein V4671_29200 [Armatimonadota bacterium]